MAWGQGFETAPQVIDSADEDTVFSPNGDGVQDELLISFVTNGSLGDFRIMIDTHGPSAVGPPDGAFNPSDDWVVEGRIGLGVELNSDPRVFREVWDGRDFSAAQAERSPRLARDGVYQIRIEIDLVQDGQVSTVQSGYAAVTLSATIDTVAPQLSSSAIERDFSPNGDGIKDAISIAYSLSEDVAELNFGFSDAAGRPEIPVGELTQGNHTFIWNGADGLGTLLADENYTLQWQAVDKGGNTGTFSAGAFRIDTVAPVITQIVPPASSFQNSAISQVEANFDPGSGSPIDFNTNVTRLILTKDGEARTGILSRSEAENRVILTLDKPLSASEENGAYALNISGSDKAGNRVQREVNFTFDTVAPNVTGIASDGGALTPNAGTSAQLTFVEAALEDNIVDGVNFAGSTIRLSGPGGGAVAGVQRSLSGARLRWTLGFPLATDGSDDGSYTITVTPLDRAGNAGEQIQLPFFYDTQAPELASLLSETGVQLNAPAGSATFLNSSLSVITANFDDTNGSGVNFDAARIAVVKVATVEGEEDTVISGNRTVDRNNNRVQFRLDEPLQRRDGSQDGAYRIEVVSADRAGNTETQRFDVIYDTQVPAVVSTTPAANTLVSTLSQVSVVLNATSGIDFAATTVRLLRADETQVTTTVRNNGRDTITLTPATPLAIDGSDDGMYFIEVVPNDLAGNAGATVRSRFFYASKAPEIRFITPSGTQTNSLDRIEVQLLNYIGTGFDSRTNSTIRVTAPDGTVLGPRALTLDTETLQLVWEIARPLSRNGSADGEYSVRVEYRDLAGQTFTEDVTLTLDTQAPAIESSTPAAGARVSQLSQIAVQFAQDLSGLDNSNTQVRLLAPDGTAIGTNRTYNGSDTITLRFNPLRTDGSADGVYTIEVTPADRAGNVGESPTRIEFTYAALSARVVLSTPNSGVTNRAATNQLESIVALVQNYAGPGVDFQAPETTVRVTDPDGAEIPARAVENNGVDQLTWIAASSVPSDGSVDGTYTVNATYVDKAGATFSQTFTVTYDTLPPSITSTTPALGARVSTLNTVRVNFADNLSGINFASTTVRLINPSGTEVQSTKNTDGANQVSLAFNALKTDGSEDGVYRIEVTPIDNAGNVGGLATITFTYATSPPEIATLTPAADSVANRVPEIRVEMIDRSGQGIDFDASSITLRSAAGEAIPGTLRHDSNLTLFLQVALPTDGTADGTYTVELRLVDQLGTVGNYTRRFTYDSQPPRITQESRPPAENTIAVNRVEVAFDVTDSGAGVDFAASTAQLLDTDNVAVNGVQANEGANRISFVSDTLPRPGVYTLLVTLVDLAGNSGIPQRFTYDYRINPPRVASISPPNRGKVNQLTQVVVTLEDQSGAGIDFSSSGSSIQLQGPDSQLVEGDVTNNGENQLTLAVKIPLLTNGDDDGTYTVTVTPVDKVGTTGQARQFTFTYDTQAPVIEAVSHIDLTATVSHASQLITRIEATFSDTGAGVDFLQSTVQLLNPDGEVVPGLANNDDTTKVWWQLNTPLSRNGSADGLYTVVVKAVDEAGNVEEKNLALRYDTVAPTVTSIQATQNGGTLVELLGESIALVTLPIRRLAIRLDEADGSGVDLANTTVRLVSPSGDPVGATQSDNGAETVFLAFNPLRADGTDDGLYTIEVTPTDRAGNTFTSPATFRFFYGTRKPEVVSTTPAEFSFAQQVTSVTAVLLDHSGQGLDFDRSTIRLITADGTVIAGRQTKDEAQSAITWALDQPLPRNGDADGTYGIQLSIFDKASNQLEVTRAFVYDTRIPTVTAVSANTTPPTPIRAGAFEVINQSFTAISVTLSDGEDSAGVDLTNTTVRLLAPGDSPVSANVRHNGRDTITISFAQLRQFGTYTLEVTPQDFAGNVPAAPMQFKFGIELGGSSVASVTIGGQTAPVEFVNQLNEIRATLVDASGVGIDLTPDGSTIAVIGPNGAVEGDQRFEGVNTITWRPLQLPADGSADGVYTVTVTPVDSLGRTGTLTRHQVTLDTQEPEVVSVTPIDLAQPVSYIGQQIAQISLQVSDVGPAGIRIADQMIQLRAPNGTNVSGALTNNNTSTVFFTLTQPLATDGSADGEYTVNLTITDRANNREQITHRLVYDTRSPTLTGTDPADGSLTSDDITVVSATLTDAGDSGIDFVASQLTLIAPNGEAISGRQDNNGRDVLRLHINGLTTDGNYTIRVLAVDRAGNGANTPFETRFTFSSGLPVVVSTTPPTAPADRAFASGPLEEVVLELQSGDGSNRSTMTLTGPSGTTVPGQQVRNGEQLTYRLLRPLATDGSDDGTYTITVTPISSTGRQGQPVTFTFLYDTLAPEIDTDAITLVVAEPGVNNALSEIRAIITDDAPSSGLDWDNLENAWVRLEKIGTNQTVRGVVSSDRQQTLTFRLTTPLASNGSQDGQYRVTIAPEDRAGNAESVVYEFFYDTRAPVIDTAAVFINDQPLIVDSNDPDYPTPARGGAGVVIRATLRDVSIDGTPGQGVDLSQSSITVTSPDGNPINGSLTQNGTDGIEFKSGALTTPGLYQVTIRSVGLDEANLGFRPIDTVSTQFLHETTKPIATLTDFGGETVLEDEALPLTGTASDPAEGDIPAAGVSLVEIVGVGPDGQQIDPVVAEDDSREEEEPWSRWSLDFLPSQSGEYDLDIRVTDRAGNVGIYDAVTVNISVSLLFKGPTYVWPNPLRKSLGDIAHFSFDVNTPGGRGAQITLSIYDFAGDLVYEREYRNLSAGRDNDQIVTWDLKNASGANVARGVYIFRIEAEDSTTGNRVNAVDKLLVVE